MVAVCLAVAAASSCGTSTGPAPRVGEPARTVSRAPAAAPPSQRRAAEGRIRASDRRARSLEAKGRYAQAIDVETATVAAAEKAFGPDDLETVTYVNELAALYLAAANYARAEPLFKRALAIREKVLGNDHPDTAELLNNLSALYNARGEYAKAQPLLMRALAICEKALGPGHRYTAMALNNLAAVYYAQGEYMKAEPLAKRALAIRERALGADHPETAEAINTLAEVYKSQGAYAKARPLLERALALREKTLGPDHPDTANSLGNLAALYESHGQYAKAEPLLRRALVIREKLLGPDHPDTATSLSVLADLFLQQGVHAKAEPLYERALAIREKTLGADHPDTAAACDSLASLYQLQGELSRAEPLYRRALAIREKALRVGHPEIARSVRDLAALYEAQGRAGDAERIYRRALTISERAVGAFHADTADAVASLARFYVDQGQYGKAEAHYQRALAISEKALGPEHPETANALANLAMLFEIEGQYTKAEALHGRALALREKVLGPEHLDTAASVGNLSVLYRREGEYGKAEALQERALAIREKAVGPEHIDTAKALANLAEIHVALGQDAKAEPLYERALAIFEKALGPNHPDTATVLNGMAEVYRARGQLTRAEPLYDRTLVILKKTLGPEHPHTISVLKNLALLKMTAREPVAALALEERAAAARERFLTRELPSKSDAERLAFMQTIGDETDVLISWSISLGGDAAGPRARRLALQMLLQRKGRVLDLGREALGLLRSRAVEADRRQIDLLQGVRAALAALTFAQIPPGEGSETRRLRRAELADQADKLEADLGRRFDELRTELTPVTVGAVQSRLGSDKALIEIAAFHPFSATARTESERWGPERYAAFVLHARGEPDVIDLGERAPLDASLSAWLAAIEGRLEQANALGRRLHERVMAPLLSALAGKRDLWISPDGALSAAPWAALVDGDGAYMLSTHRLTYLTSGRDLLRQGGHDEARGPIVVMGAPAYDRPDSNSAIVPRQAGMLRFEPLPKTEEEAREVAARWPGVKLYVGANATEAVLKGVHRPQIVHLATHGFFLEPATHAPLSRRDGRGVTLEVSPGPPRRPVGPSENPLLFSGVALAGANGPGVGPDDGLLFALEVSALDLRGTKLVVLSACQTGQGSSVNGEGLYGLRRALVLAGSQSQVLSLWNVQDEATARFMVALHDKLAKGAARADALRDVQRAFLADPPTAAPFFWASFFLQGDPSSFAGRPPVPLLRFPPIGRGTGSRARSAARGQSPGRRRSNSRAPAPAANSSGCTSRCASIGRSGRGNSIVCAPTTGPALPSSAWKSGSVNRPPPTCSPAPQARAGFGASC